MCKKILSYFIVFSILHSNAAWCGSFGSKFGIGSDEEAGERRPLTPPKGSPSGTPPKDSGLSSIEFQDWTFVNGGSTTTTATTTTSSDAKRTSSDEDGEIPEHLQINFEDVSLHDNDRDQGGLVLLSDTDTEGQIESDGESLNFQKSNGSANLPRVYQPADGLIITSVKMKVAGDSDTWQKVDFIETKNTTVPKLVPDWCKAPHVETDEEAVDGLDYLLNLKDLDEELTLEVVPLTKLEQLLDDFPKGARNTLRDLVGWEKYIAMGIGAGIGGGTAYGTAGVFTQSIVHLASEYNNDFINLLNGGYLFKGVAAATACDAIFRNGHYGKMILSYLSRQDANMGYVLAIGTVSFLPSLITPFALISADLEWMDWNAIVGLDNEIAREMLIFSPFLYLDSLAFNMDMASEIWTNMKKWAEISQSFSAHQVRKILPSNPPTPEEMTKRDIHQKFDRIVRHLPNMTDEEVKERYEVLYNAKSTIADELSELDPENREAALAFLTLYYLLEWETELAPEEKTQQKTTSPHTKLQDTQADDLCDLLDETLTKAQGSPLLCEDQDGEGKSLTQSWHETYKMGTEWLTRGVLVIGTPARLVTLTFIAHDILNAIFGPAISEESKWGCAWPIGSFGFSIQTALEYKGMKNFAQMWWNKKYEGHESHPWVRKAAKLCSTGYGFFLASFAVGVLALQSWSAQYGEDWLENEDEDAIIKKWMTIASIIAYVLPEGAVLATLTEHFLNHILVSGSINIYNGLWAKGLSRKSQQDWLICFVKEQQGKVQHLSPDVLDKLNELLETKANRKSYQL